jgi:hypothetical protein
VVSIIIGESTFADGASSMLSDKLGTLVTGTVSGPIVGHGSSREAVGLMPAPAAVLTS